MVNRTQFHFETTIAIDGGCQAEVFHCETIEVLPYCAARFVAWEGAVARKTEELRPVMTRLPEALRRRLEREAARNHRSMNTEIIHRLEDSFFRGSGVDRQTLRDEIKLALLAFLSVVRGDEARTVIEKRLTQVMADSVIQSAKPKIEDDGEKK